MANFLERVFGNVLPKSSNEVKKESVPSFVRPQIDDSIIVGDGSFAGQYIDMEGSTKNESELIVRYRDMANQPEVDIAIDDIVNESVVSDEKNQPIELILDEIDEIGDGTKKKIVKEFEYILELMNFKNRGHDIFRRWYVDGRIYFQKVLDKNKQENGILELKYIDPRKIRKGVVQKTEKTSTNVTLYKKSEEFYLFNDRGFGQPSSTAVKISKDEIAYVNSGVYDYKTNAVLSHLNKAIKPFNQLRMLEDAVVIYRLARAPERRIFYIDVGNLPKMKAEQYLREIMTKHKNKLTYNSQTGEVKDDRKFTTMLEDYWLPRREGGKGTEITTLSGGQTLGELDDVEYFRKKLYKSLNVPTSRIEDSTFNIGRATEISRDEVKFSKFIARLRSRFSDIFNDLLRTQLIVKKIITADEWDNIRKKLVYNWLRDNFFSEMKDREIWNDRLNTLQVADNYQGKYFPKEWIMKKLLNLDDEEIEDMNEQMEKEAEEDAANMQQDPNADPNGGPDQGQDQEPTPPGAKGPPGPDQGPDKGYTGSSPPGGALARPLVPPHKKKDDKKKKKKVLHPGPAKPDVKGRKEDVEPSGSLKDLLEDIKTKVENL